VLSDRTAGIRASVAHVELELVLAVVMVVLVIFAFLHSVRATIIASLAVPMTLWPSRVPPKHPAPRRLLRSS